ncbi:D-Ala-D-Ala carboxypeptidase family metallohydrolase [Angustibacter aerolatus]|uniref:Peptidase M15A C-terminal domain-containing protein n=1 Tax=Angustibacter aerolatus TaxID=1162965 RepID=A0ABQ6JMW0_9ACTN|nr:D-Ala-D-Ala carboxypeptidase family metallohydrolase [Angustibacter aerolatus]GMA88595.1 hypothetical protein GCM10025868_38450 [Angustibacter aerolatus]
MASILTAPQAKAALTAIGFDNAGRSLAVAVEGFQRGWNLGSALKVDGVVGEHTSDALRLSLKRHTVGRSTMSAHFSFVEFRCKDGGAFPECRRIWMLRAHVRRLEAYRASVGVPVRIVSGCRCKRYNAKVGGATHSQHQFGCASDVQPLRTVQQRRQAKLFAGLGFKQSNQKVVHVDSRDLGGHDLTGGTPSAPTTWVYAT